MKADTFDIMMMTCCTAVVITLTVFLSINYQIKTYTNAGYTKTMLPGGMSETWILPDCNCKGVANEQESSGAK
jgi:hypothetical protein